MIRQMKNIPCILVVSRGQGFMSVEGVKRAENFGSSINRTPCSGEIHRLPVAIVLFGNRKIQVNM